MSARTSALSRLARVPRPAPLASAPRVGRVLAVVGASGGVGATTLAAAVAVRAVGRGVSAVVVDGDPVGGGLDVRFGAEASPGLRWHDLAGLEGDVDGAAVLAGLVTVDGVGVLAADGQAPDTPGGQVFSRVVGALSLVAGLVVVDLPRDGRWTEPGLEAADAAVVVACTHVGSLASLAAVAPRVASRIPETFLCVRGETRHRGHVVDLVHGELDLPVVGWLPERQAVATDLEHGIPPGLRWRGDLLDSPDRLVDTFGVTGTHDGSATAAGRRPDPTAAGSRRRGA